MKPSMLIIAFICIAGARSHAQTIAVMAEQLAALQVLQQTTTQGYEATTNGLDNIGEFTASEFQLHQTYFGSLATINPSFIEDPKLAALWTLQNALVQKINAEIAHWRQQQNHQ